MLFQRMLEQRRARALRPGAARRRGARRPRAHLRRGRARLPQGLPHGGRAQRRRRWRRSCARSAARCGARPRSAFHESDDGPRATSAASASSSAGSASAAAPSASEARQFGLPVAARPAAAGRAGLRQVALRQGGGAEWQLPAAAPRPRRGLRRARRRAPSSPSARPSRSPSRWRRRCSGSTRSRRASPPPAADPSASRVFGVVPHLAVGEAVARSSSSPPPTTSPQLPPELLRRGRFDELFFVDLPTRAERAEILAIHLRKRGRDPLQFPLARARRAGRAPDRRRARAGRDRRALHGLRRERASSTDDGPRQRHQRDRPALRHLRGADQGAARLGRAAARAPPPSTPRWSTSSPGVKDRSAGRGRIPAPWKIATIAQERDPEPLGELRAQVRTGRSRRPSSTRCPRSTCAGSAGSPRAKEEILTYACAATNPEVYGRWGTYPPSGLLLIGQQRRRQAPAGPRRSRP